MRPSQRAGSGGAAGKLRIAVIPKGTTHEFWKSVHAGAARAASELGVEIVWKGPMKEDDLRAQIELVQSFIAQKVTGIVHAPLSDKALASPVRAARDAGIPVVVFDSDLQSDVPVSFVATDNVAAGRMAGDEIPIAARITAIADVFDALVSPRSYKAAWPHERALTLLREEAGSHFDPHLVACLEEIMDVVAKIYERFPDAEPEQPSREMS